MSGEGCPLQVASIFDIAGGRHALGLSTYAGFIDVRKAYDTIPYELIFSELEANGITGHRLSFLEALYRDSIVQVKTGEAPGILSDPILIERELRQGCLTSPILFHILIHYVFDGIQGLGCEVAGCIDMLDSRQSLRVPGQLFADDTVGLALSLDNLHAIFVPFSQWSEDHCMGFGVKKCGVMALGRHSGEVVLREQDDRWQLGGNGYRLYLSIHSSHKVRYY
jgi:hypothetical protein